MLVKFSTKLLGIAAAAMLLAACASKTNTTDGGDGTGGDGVPQGFTEKLASVGDRVFFDLDRYDVKPEGMAVLQQQQAALLSEYPDAMVTIEGHCDERGTREYNIALGDRRANAVREALISFGVDRARISTISYGKDKPECGDSSEACWSTNRRGVTVARAAPVRKD